MNPGPITFGVPMFEDAYGNKMSDVQWHAHVNNKLNGGRGIDQVIADALDDPFAS